MSDLLKRLEAIEAEARVLRAEIAAKESKPWEPWTPGIAQAYWVVNAYGGVAKWEWNNTDADRDRRDFNNCKPSEQFAERHAKRLRSMKATCPVPKVGEKCYAVVVNPHGWVVKETTWGDSPVYQDGYNLGRVFTTEETADAWIAEFGDVWTTLEDEA